MPPGYPRCHKMLAARLLPSAATFFSALTTTKCCPASPHPYEGWNDGLCLPRRRIAMIEAEPAQHQTVRRVDQQSHFVRCPDGLGGKGLQCPSMRKMHAAGSRPIRKAGPCKRSAAPGQAGLSCAGGPVPQSPYIEGERRTDTDGRERSYRERARSAGTSTTGLLAPHAQPAAGAQRRSPDSI